MVKRPSFSKSINLPLFLELELELEMEIVGDLSPRIDSVRVRFRVRVGTLN